jgi:hypothetical protein
LAPGPQSQSRIRCFSVDPGHGDVSSVCFYLDDGGLRVKRIKRGRPVVARLCPLRKMLRQAASEYRVVIKGYFAWYIKHLVRSPTFIH